MKVAKIKKKKVSKKTKKSWRKYVDTEDVDKFLEDARLEERLGGSFTKRKDSELFEISTTPQVLSKKERRQLLSSKEPRCFNILKPLTAVPDPIVKRNRVRTKEERKHSLILRKEALRKAQGILKLKERIRIENRLIAAKRKLNKPKRGDFNKDAWHVMVAKDINTDWMTTNTVRHTLTHFGVKKKKLPTSLHKKPSILPAVEVPHPGSSYNPSFEDHQRLLQEVAQKELQLIKEEKHLERVTTKMFRKVTPEEKENENMKEMLEGLKQDKENNNIDEVDKDPVVKFVNLPVMNRKKTRQQRRKQKEQKELEFERQQKKVEKKKISDIYKLKQLDKQLVAKESKLQVLRDKRLKRKALKEMGPKTLSKVKFEPLEQDFKLAKELTGNLRNAEPSGNLLKDRFKSLQQRNIVAPSKVKLKRDKAKVKRFIKPDHKIDVSKVK